MPISTAERDNRLGTFRAAAYTDYATHYISLHTGDPGLTGANEHGGTAGYARVAVTAGTSAWSAPATNGSVREITNSNPITFPVATADYSAAITHFGVWSAASGGTFIRGAALDASKTIQNGDTPSFAAGVLKLQEQ